MVTGVLPRAEALALLDSAKAYIGANAGSVRAFPPADPAVYELYWSPAQVAARAHPRVLATQRFLQGLWHSSDGGGALSTAHPLAYADRLRVRRPGDAGFALGPHVDGGSLERWQDPGYRRTYSEILRGRWERYDAFDAAHRVGANMDLYNGAGACAMFRMFQGWLGLSDTAPGEGTLRLLPALAHATAYMLLRPLFGADGRVDVADPRFPGAAKGACQEFSAATHPHLELERAMVSVPAVAPGDYVAWHCDMLHSVDREHRGPTAASVMYIPATPLTTQNVRYLARQRDAALAGAVPPDFPHHDTGEAGFEGRVRWADVSKEGRRAMGMEKWEAHAGSGPAEQRAVAEANAVIGR